jgi:hypothetical protein
MDAAIQDLDADGRAGVDMLGAGLREGTFYLFNSEAMLAASHAIEDLALDEANGRLLATFQDFRNFTPQRERYWQLAATIDEVLVLAAGKKPPRHGRLKFISVAGSPLSEFWIVMYQGRRTAALLLCRQVNDARVFEEKRFAGLYTFNPRLIARVRDDLDALLKRRGRAGGLHEFERLAAIDRTVKRIRVEFARESAAIEVAIRKMQANGAQMHPRKFTSEMDRALDRLRTLKSRLARDLESSDSPDND